MDWIDVQGLPSKKAKLHCESFTLKGKKDPTTCFFMAPLNSSIAVQHLPAGPTLSTVLSALPSSLLPTTHFSLSKTAIFGFISPGKFIHFFLEGKGRNFVPEAFLGITETKNSFLSFSVGMSKVEYTQTHINRYAYRCTHIQTHTHMHRGFWCLDSSLISSALAVQSCASYVTSLCLS